MQVTESSSKKRQYTYDPDKIKFITFEQAQSILKEAKSASTRDYALLCLSFYHGLRISEPGKLQIGDYDESTQRIRVRRAKGGLGFTYKLHDECITALKRWLAIRGKDEGPLFPSRKSNMVDGGKGISTRQLDEIFKTYAERAGIPEELRHFHVLRHGIAVHMVDKGIPLLQISDWLGHRSIQSTQIYAKVSDNARNKTAEMLYEKEGKRLGEVVGKVKKVDWGKDKKK